MALPLWLLLALEEENALCAVLAVIWGKVTSGLSQKPLHWFSMPELRHPNAYVGYALPVRVGEGSVARLPCHDSGL